jgi:hypothetical protein
MDTRMTALGVGRKSDTMTGSGDDGKVKVAEAELAVAWTLSLLQTPVTGVHASFTVALNLTSSPRHNQL